MEERNIFRNLSPLDHRYYLANRELFETLADYMSEEAGIRYCVAAEASLLKAYVRRFFKGEPEYLKIIDALPSTIDPAEVYEEEEKTQHNIRALVNVIKRKIPKELSPYVHLGATSVDILDTALSMRVRDAVQKAVLPLILDIEELLIKIVHEEAETPQIGRTHGQHAIPITLGFALSAYVSRIGKSAVNIHALSKQLCGKLSGAVGGYNSTSMIVSDPFELEEEYVKALGLEASEHSTQLVEPEYLLRLFLEMNLCFGILANLADDLRHLQRSEISEVREFFGGDQVGSSTMPQKRNPWNSEHVKSLWKAFAPRVMTLFMDQISEHQRDLTNSASQRFLADYVAGFSAALARMKKVLAGLYVDRERLLANLNASGGMVLAEAAYILLSVSGDPEAHERLRKITLACERDRVPLYDELSKDEGLVRLLDVQLGKTLGIDSKSFFSHPELYRGKAAEKAKRLADKYLVIARNVREECADD